MTCSNRSRLVYFAGVIRVPCLGLLALLACQPPPARAPEQPESSPDAETSPELSESTRPGREFVERLPPAISIAGLPDPPTSWPEPVPTVRADGALSIRALRLDPDPLLAAASAGEVVRLNVFVQAHEARADQPIRTWCVDRELDLGRVDQGIPVEPALPTAQPGARITLVARLEQRQPPSKPELVLVPIAWADADAETETETWQAADGSIVAPGSWPAETEPSAFLRRASEASPPTLADDLEQAIERLDRAALADDGALAERHARRALELDPDNVEVWSTLIALYHGYGQHAHHLAALQASRALGLAQLDGLWLDYGSIDVALGEFVHARALLDQAVALAPDSLVANFYLATAHWLLGEHELARPGYTKVLELAGSKSGREPIELMMIDTAETRLAELDH